MTDANPPVPNRITTARPENKMNDVAAQPDPSASRAVLIGVTTYHSPELDALPSVGNNIRQLAALLTDRELWGLPKKHCRVLCNPSRSEALDTIHEATSLAEDAFVLYYAGHGLVSTQNELHLALSDASSQRLYQALRYDEVRSPIIDACSARSKVVLLDCCFSGWAMQGHMSGSARTLLLADHTSINGTYVMTASAETKLALAPKDERYTAFTGALLDTLSRGVPGAPDLLDMDTVYREVRQELSAKGRPEPQQRARNSGHRIALVRNRRGPSKPAAGHLAGELPEQGAAPGEGTQERNSPSRRAKSGGSSKDWWKQFVLWVVMTLAAALIALVLATSLVFLTVWWALETFAPVTGLPALGIAATIALLVGALLLSRS
ncbi:caspase domain-containing protein [Streptomyces sp. NPDC002187]|uniref:caspase family protein n=1 Tax=Streptomyces sp. NPDC002187 TaxID=3364637 RepID=UPI0036958EBB